MSYVSNTRFPETILALFLSPLVERDSSFFTDIWIYLYFSHGPFQLWSYRYFTSVLFLLLNIKLLRSKMFTNSS